MCRACYGTSRPSSFVLHSEGDYRDGTVRSIANLQQVLCAVEPWLPLRGMLLSNHDQKGHFRLGGCVDERGLRWGWISGFTGITAYQRPPIDSVTFVPSHPVLRRTSV